MAKSDRTKKLFADKLQELAEHKQIKDIQVKELCAACEVERTTFYYYFCDKYDLVAWIFEQNYKEEAEKAAVLNNEEMIFNMLKRILKQKKFFANALQDHSQNNLRQYMLNFYINYERKLLCQYLNCNNLDEEMEYAIRHYSYGCMGHTIEWLLGKNDLSAEKMAYYQYKFMPDIMKKAAAKISDV
ncbi:MAG: TetR family transcriptional regulator [Firmicutes bacterium]|nr:TetR family transcriptional regulator [Bacillota bacterium]